LLARTLNPHTGLLVALMAWTSRLFHDSSRNCIHASIAFIAITIMILLVGFMATTNQLFHGSSRNCTHIGLQLLPSLPSPL